MDVSELRRSKVRDSLEREDLDEDAIRQFEQWFTEACDEVSLDPNAMALSTVDANNRPSSRTVLLKYFDTEGFVFFTNYESNKARDIDSNPNVSLLFFWAALGRQVKVQGRASRISKKETLKYFATRPRGSQIGAWVSPQSSVITSRSILEAKYEELKRKFAEKNVSLPAFWGGYRVVPEEIEFWQSRRNRLHDRFRYRREAAGDWQIDRLAP